jgi:hypothetical protein
MIEFPLEDQTILTLLTTFDEKEEKYHLPHNDNCSETCHTRSVLLFNPTLQLPKEEEEEVSSCKNKLSIIDKSKWIIVDNLQFHLFLSIPLDVSIETLTNYMFFNYWATFYGSIQNWNNNEKVEYDKKGYYGNESYNPNITNTVKETLQIMDEINKSSLHKKITNLWKRKRSNDNNDEEKEEDDEEEDDEDGHRNIDFIKDIQVLREDRDTMNVYYKLAFDNHILMTYFLKKFSEGPVLLKTRYSNGTKVPITVKIWNYFRANDLLPIRIDFSSMYKVSDFFAQKNGIDSCDIYMENQLPFMKQDLRETKRKKDGSTVKLPLIKNSFKLRFEGKDDDFISCLDDTSNALLQPSHYSSYVNGSMEPKHKLVNNHAKQLIPNLRQSHSYPSLYCQSLYIDLSNFNNEWNGGCGSDAPTQTFYIVQCEDGKMVHIKKSSIREEKKKQIKKSIHYNLNQSTGPDKLVYTSRKKIKLDNSKAQSSIVSFLSSAK